MNIVCDFESHYDTANNISIATQGLFNYINTQEAYCVSMACDEFEFCGTIEQAREQFPPSFWANSAHQFFAAHSNFDEAWTEKYYGPTARHWQCILDIAVGNQLPRDVANLARVVLGTPVDKSLRDFMNGVRFSELAEEKQQEILSYCLNDSIQEKKLLDNLSPLSPIEAEIAALTRLQNRRGVYIDVDRVDKDMTMLHRIRHTAMLHVPWRHDCNGEEGLRSKKKMARWAESKGIPVPKSIDKRDSDCTDLMSDHPELNDALTWLRKFVSAATLIKKGETLRDRLTPDNRLPLDLLYCGAPHTRRWSAQGWNIQNLAKEPLFGEIVLGEDGKPDPEKSERAYLRNWLIPKAGKKFLIFDLGQIEPRCLNWLAGNDPLLEMIRAGFGLYEAYAATFKGWRGKPGTLKKENLKLYTSWKSEVLGLGYGMGAAKYVTKAAEDGIILTPEQSKEIVTTFRRDNPKITRLWSNFDELIKKTVLSSDRCLEIEMPTGDKLRHFHLRQTSKITEDGYSRASYMSSKTRGVFDERGSVRNLWGGVLTENVTQRMARDIFAEAMLRAEKAGFLARFSAHDEGIFEVDDGNEKFLAEQKDELERILTTPPEWCPDIPLAVEGSYEDRYTK